MISPWRRAVASALLIAVLTLGACSAAPAAPPPTATPTATRTLTPTPTPTPPTAISPLRGIDVLASTITGPALAAKIDNHGDARPQWGLERTDIVFEELVEGGLTGYVAVWFSDVPPEVGPVRSIRPMDPDIVSPLGGVIAYSGGQQRFVDMMLAAPVHNAIHGGADDRFMYRTNSKRAPHNVIVKAEELRASYATIAPPTQQFSYSRRPSTASAAAYGLPTSSLDLSFSRGESRWWRWDAATGTYLRSQNTRPDLDPQGAQLRATNVVVMSVGIDRRYGDVPKTVMVGSGQAWVSTGGRTLEATWTKTGPDAPIVLTNQYGVPIYLAAGNTWVELLPQGQPLAMNP